MVVTAIFRAKPGKESALRAQLHAGARASWQELGVRGYFVHEIVDQPGSFMSVEIYTDDAAFKSHLNTSHVKSLIEKLDDLLIEPLTVYQGVALFEGEDSKAAL